MLPPVRTIEEFYSHALAIEHEAARSYRELCEHFADRGEEVFAILCAELARTEQEHYELLEKQSRGLALPAIDAAGYGWIESASLDAAREFVYQAVSPRALLKIALKAEREARQFFRRIAAIATDPQVHAMAEEMVRHEDEHVRWVLRALDSQPPEDVDWDRLIADDTGPGLALGVERRLRKGRAVR